MKTRMTQDSLFSPFLYQLIMQASFFRPGRPVIFTCSTCQRHNKEIIREEGEEGQFAVLGYMKDGQTVAQGTTRKVISFPEVC